MPNLTKKEWLNLFGVWLDHCLARLEVQRAEAYARMLKVAEELRKVTPREQPFRCICGAVLGDPFAGRGRATSAARHGCAARPEIIRLVSRGCGCGAQAQSKAPRR